MRYPTNTIRMPPWILVQGFDSSTRYAGMAVGRLYGEMPPKFCYTLDLMIQWPFKIRTIAKAERY